MAGRGAQMDEVIQVRDSNCLDRSGTNAYGNSGQIGELLEMKSTRFAHGFDIWSEWKTRVKDDRQDSYLNNNVEGSTI